MPVGDDMDYITHGHIEAKAFCLALYAQMRNVERELSGANAMCNTEVCTCYVRRVSISADITNHT